MTAEFLKRQQEEQKTMAFWNNCINNYPNAFLVEYEKLDFLQKCKLRSFIQYRDSELYKKMLKIIGEEE